MRIDILSSLPHPVLGRGDDVRGTYEVTDAGSIRFERDKISIPVTHSLSNKTIENLLLNHDVAFCVEINCPQTFCRETFLGQKMDDIIEVPADKLRRKTEMNFYIVASKDISGYTIDGANKDYEGFKFEIKKGDVLGYGGSTYFYAEKDWVEPYQLLRVVKTDDEDQKEFRVDLTDEEHIVVYLPEQDYIIYRQLLQTGKFNKLFHACIAVPVFMHTLYQMMDNSDPSMKATRWYQILYEHKERNENIAGMWNRDNVSELAQILLEVPLTSTLQRTFDEFD